MGATKVSLTAASRLKPESADKLFDVRMVRDVYAQAAEIARRLVGQLAPVNHENKVSATRS